MTDNTLISRIINLRESKDWSQAELGRRLGVDKSVMNKIENGTRKVSTDELAKLSKIFNVSSDYLLNGDDGYKREWDNSFEEMNDKLRVVAAHIDDDATEEDLEDILRYIEYRKNNPLKKKK
ncbi:helix-turn-helix domain-containing protein [Enterococcus sp. RIT-PI-f]|jgi:transcriptional regulator with XRE-family HTH domain|uniref:helix-turn-helix domain-containing protein n=1 Tax=Enterococcus sp. RIT-PI-f TaxID=1690244 RepID=UPI00356951E2